MTFKSISPADVMRTCCHARDCQVRDWECWPRSARGWDAELTSPVKHRTLFRLMRNMDLVSEEGFATNCILLMLLVAGEGFEPSTFGL